MIKVLSSPSALPTAIFAGIGVVFLVLVCVLPPAHVFALVSGTALALGLALARMRREAFGDGLPPVRPRARR